MLRPLNLYAFFQFSDDKLLHEYKLIMSGSKQKTKKHEMESLRGVSRLLRENGATIEELDGYYFAYTIPKIGKEFDLLRIADKAVLNIELKSVNVGLSEIREQLLRNRYYLRHLGKKMYFFTYVLTEDCFYTLNVNDQLVKASPQLAVDAARETNCFYSDDPDELFSADDFIFSPLSDAERFLEKRYFLTQHQERIKAEIVPSIKNKSASARFFSVSGGSGTGKTLLMYDIAVEAARLCKAVIICCDASTVNCGEKITGNVDGLDIIDQSKLLCGENLCGYQCILVDDAHLLSQEAFSLISDSSVSQRLTCIFFLDSTQLISLTRRTNRIAKQIKAFPEISSYELTSRIRTNPETAAFVTRLLDLNAYTDVTDYKNIFLYYAATAEEAEKIARYYSARGYEYIDYMSLQEQGSFRGNEYDKVLVLMDRTFSYDNEGKLRAIPNENGEKIYETLLYLALTRAKNGIAIVVVDNKKLFGKIASIYTTSPSGKSTYKAKK